MNIVIIAHFAGALDGTGNGRFIDLAEVLAKEHDVELITTDLHNREKAPIF